MIFYLYPGRPLETDTITDAVLAIDVQMTEMRSLPSNKLATQPPAPSVPVPSSTTGSHSCPRPADPSAEPAASLAVSNDGIKMPTVTSSRPKRIREPRQLTNVLCPGHIGTASRRSQSNTQFITFAPASAYFAVARAQVGRILSTLSLASSLRGQLDPLRHAH